MNIIQSFKILNMNFIKASLITIIIKVSYEIFIELRRILKH